MGSEGCTNQVENCQAMPTKPAEKSDSNAVAVESHKEIVDKTNPLVPITPDSNRENGDFPVDYDSPRSMAKKTTSVARCNSSISPHTPKEGVFDPFAPGPDAKALAPQCRKYVSKSRGIVARRLSFDDSVKDGDYDDDDDDDDVMISVSDEEIVEAVYESLLEIIVSKQTEVALAEASDRDWDSSHCVTPPSAPRLSGIAETCPGAPLRPGVKSRKVDPALCRRLQFSP